jgi:hypothetical protein
MADLGIPEEPQVVLVEDASSLFAGELRGSPSVTVDGRDVVETANELGAPVWG